MDVADVLSSLRDTLAEFDMLLPEAHRMDNAQFETSTFCGLSHNYGIRITQGEGDLDKNVLTCLQRLQCHRGMGGTGPSDDDHVDLRRKSIGVVRRPGAVTIGSSEGFSLLCLPPDQRMQNT